MNKRKKSNLVGDVAIISEIIAIMISIFSIMFHVYNTSPIVLLLMLIHIAFRDMYLDCRKDEIDELLKKDNE